jgi:polyisoprenyl-teichoic acid--peptidoglycan teichoic acid transferase
MSSRLDKKTKKKKKTWVKVLIGAFLILFVAVGAYAFTVYNSLTTGCLTSRINIRYVPYEKWYHRFLA